MSSNLKSKQSGASLVGMLLIGAALAVVGLLGLLLVQAEIEHRVVRKAVFKASQAASVMEARAIFDKAATVDDIKSLTSADLQMVREGEKLVVRYAYQRETHLIGPAYLLLKYSGQSQ